MSRAFRIQVEQRLNRVNKASDHVSTQLEILEILPCDETAEVLAQELKARGFEQKGDKMVRREKGVVIEVDPKTAEVVVRAEGEEEVDLEAARSVVADANRALQADTRKKVQEDLQKSLEAQADGMKKKLQQEVSERLEGRLADLQNELNQVVNKVTAESLKRRAAQIGNVKEVSEDEKSGSLKIVVEV